MVGTEGETGIDICQLRAKTGAITLDPGYGNTGACESAITFIDGEKGILRYRGFPIEELAEQAALHRGRLPADLRPAADRGRARRASSTRLTRHTLIHEDMKQFFEGYPASAHPMAILSSMVASLSTLLPGATDRRSTSTSRACSPRCATIAAFSYKKTIGQPFIYPQNELSYCANFLHMMFAVPAEPYEVSPVLERALNLLLILHADHEQNCSTSTVRMVGSSQANLFASIAAGICALWGPLHGGANQEVIEMLERDPATTAATTRSSSTWPRTRTRASGSWASATASTRTSTRARRILKEAADEVLAKLGINDPLLDIAKQLEEAALKDELLRRAQALPERRLLQRHHLPRDGHPDRTCSR